MMSASTKHGGRVEELRPRERVRGETGSQEGWHGSD